MLNIQFFRKNTAGILIIISAFILISTLIIEYILEFPPCILCVYQRFPYLMSIILGLLLIYLDRTRLFLFVFIFFQIINSGIAVFHSLVERNFIEFEMGCTSIGNNIQTVEELRNFLEEVPITKCNEIIFSVMNLSLANLNVLASIFLIVYAIYGINKNAKI